MMKKISKKPAFTLIELLVSMSIIVMLTALFIANYRGSNRRTDLVMTAQVMVTDIRLAQSNTLGLVAYGDSFPSGGWGVHATNYENENNRYIIFADINGNGVYDVGEAEEEYGGRIIYLPRDINISHVQIGDVLDITQDENSKDFVNITFLPPDPITQINAEGEDVQVVHFLLINESTGEYEAVYVNIFGLIDVKND